MTTHTLSIQVAGSDANGDPDFTLYVNGVAIAANVSVTANYATGQWQILTYTYSSSLPTDSISIVDNSQTGGGGNVYINTVTLDGNAFQAALAPGANTSLGIDDLTTAAVLTTSQSLNSNSSMFKPASPGTLEYLGVDWNGAEYSNATLQSWNSSVEFPTNNDLQYYASKGLNIVRLSILWEQLQPTLGGALNQTYLAQIESTISEAKSLGETVDIDLHNYGTAFGGVVGELSTTNADFANLWGQLAGALKGDTNVMFGLMNEPSVQTATDWLASQNAAIAAIRAAGATTQTILVSGIDWDTASSWVSSGNAAVIGTGIVDPNNNYAFEVHQYLDTGGTGTVAGAVSTEIGMQRLEEITQWAEDTGAKLFLGEVGVSNDSTSLAALNNMLAYMSQYSNVWIGATYNGANSNAFDSIDPVNMVDSPQMGVLDQFAPGTATSEAGVQVTSYTAGNVTTYSNGNVETKSYTLNGVTLLTDTMVYTGGAKQISTYDITGQNYVTEVDQYNASGVETNLTRTNATGLLVYTYALNTTTDVSTSNQYTSAGLLSTSTITSPNGTIEYQTYASDGVTLLQDYMTNADGSKTVSTYDISGKAYTTEVDVYNSSGVETSITRKNAGGNLVYVWTYNPSTGVTTTNQYTTAGVLANVTTVQSNGATEIDTYASDGTTIIEDYQLHANGSKDFYYYDITGKSYVAEHDVYDANGNETSVTRTSATGLLVSVSLYNPATGTKTYQSFSASGALASQSIVYSNGQDEYIVYASNGTTVVNDTTTNANGSIAKMYVYTASTGTQASYQYSGTGVLEWVSTTYTNGSSDFKTYASDGVTVIRDTQKNADGSKDVYSYGGTGSSYYESELDVYISSGVETSITRYNPNCSLAYKYSYDPSTGTIVTDIYNDTDDVLSAIGTTYANGSSDYQTYASNGTTLLRDTQTNADGSKNVYTFGITGKSYVTEEDSYGTNGVLDIINRTNLNGSHTQVAYQSGLTLTATSGVADTFTSFGGDTFQLVSGAGEDVITNFTAGNGASHDTLLLSASLATSFSSLESSNMITSSGSNTLIYLGGTYSVLLDGVSPSALTAADFKFS